MAPETLQCCFLYLLRKSDELHKIDKNKFIEFVGSCAIQALMFTRSGSKIPMETELAYSSESDYEELEREEVPAAASPAEVAEDYRSAPAGQCHATEPTKDAKASSIEQSDFSANDRDSESQRNSNKSVGDGANMLKPDSRRANPKPNSSSALLVQSSQSEMIDESLNDRDLRATVSKKTSQFFNAVDNAVLMDADDQRVDTNLNMPTPNELSEEELEATSAAAAEAKF